MAKAEHCVVDLNHPPRFRCLLCRGERELSLPLPMQRVAAMATEFAREHKGCRE